MDAGTTEGGLMTILNALNTSAMEVTTGDPTTPKTTCGGSYDFVMNAMVKFVLLGFGTIGNSLSIVVMWSERNTSATAFLLIVLAVLDTLLMYTWLFLITSPTITSVKGIVNFFGYYGGYVRAYGFMFASATHLSDSWVVVLVTLQRYIAVCRPHQAKRWASMKTVRIQVAVIIVACCLFYWPIRPFQRSVHWSEENQRYEATWTKFGASFGYRVGYMVIAYYILGYFVPLGILVFTTVQLIRSLKELRDKKAEMTGGGGKKTDEVTLSLVIVVTVFFFCQMTNPLRRVFVYALRQKSACPDFQWYYNIFSNDMVILNSAVNFIIYTVCGKRFRQKLLRILGCQKAQVGPLDGTTGNNVFDADTVKTTA